MASQWPDMNLQGPDYLLAYLHSRRIVPHGGQQIRSDILIQDLAPAGWSKDTVHDSLAILEQRGYIKTIRELRSHGETLVWITLTDNGRDVFQSRQL